MKALILIPLFLFASINEKIIKFYKSYYPNIEIKKIIIHPTPPKKYKNIKFLLSPKRSFGTIKIDNKFFYLKIKAILPVCKATKIIKTNENIECKIEKVPFRNFYSKPILNFKNLVASKIISKNSIINESNTKKRPLIFKNSTISAIIKSKNILITSKAKALQDGNRGDEIRILINKRVKKAKVIDKGVVEIE